MNPRRRLTRCRHDKQLAGVASGMAEYFDLDPTIVRILWILSVFFGGFTILLYIILAFVMPLEPAGLVASPGVAPAGAAPADGVATTGSTDMTDTTSNWTASTSAVDGHDHRQRGEGRWGLAVGVLLVVFGGIALVGSALPSWVAGIALGPAFLVALGIAFVVIAIRRPTAST